MPRWSPSPKYIPPDIADVDIKYKLNNIPVSPGGINEVIYQQNWKSLNHT